MSNTVTKAGPARPSLGSKRLRLVVTTVALVEAIRHAANAAQAELFRRRAPKTPHCAATKNVGV